MPTGAARTTRNVQLATPAAPTAFDWGGAVTGALGGFIAGGPAGALIGGTAGGFGGQEAIPSGYAIPGPPQYPTATPFPGSGGGCGVPGLVRDQYGRCRPISQPFGGGGQGTAVVPVPDYNPQVITPAERSVGGATGFPAPQLVGVPTYKCPKIAGKTGILHYSPQTGAIVCLPRGVSGTAFGLVRKNKKRAKAYISAGEVKALRKRSSAAKKAKAFARMTGQTCRPAGRGR